MSGDVFSQGKGEFKTRFGRVNLNEYLDDSCGYPGVCNVDRTVNIKSDLCNICVYQSKMDIPKIINEKLEERGLD